MIYEQARRILARCPCDHQFAKWPVFCYFSSSVRIPCSPAVSYNLMLPIALRGNTVSTKAGVSTFQDSHLWLYTLCRGAHRELRKGCRKTAQCLRQDINLASTLIFPLINHRGSLCVCVCVCVCVCTRAQSGAVLFPREEASPEFAVYKFITSTSAHTFCSM